MFNFFKKKPNQNSKDISNDIWNDLEEVQSALTYYVKADGEIFVEPFLRINNENDEKYSGIKLGVTL